MISDSVITVIGKKKLRDVEKKGLSFESRIGRLRKDNNAIECSQVQHRQNVRVIGQVISTRIVPRGSGHWYEVVIDDGTAKVDGWFFGRKSIPGMDMGSVVLFEGLAQLDEGEMTIANPYYIFV